MKLNKNNPVQRTILMVTLSTLAATSGVHASLAINNNIASLEASQSLQQLSSGSLLTSVDVLQQAGISQLSQANQGLQINSSLNTLQQANQNSQQVLQLIGGGSQTLSIANQGLSLQSTVQLDPSKLMQSCEQEMRNSTMQSVLSLFNGNGTTVIQQQQTLLSLLQGGSPAQSDSGVNQSLGQQNLQSLQSQQNQLSTGLKINSGTDLSQTQNQLSTGLRINSPSQPVSAQDFQNGRLQKLGSQLDFLMLADALNSRLGQSLSLEKSLNQDALQQQLVSLNQRVLSSPYLFQCFQNMWGGDQQQILRLIGGVNVQQVGGHSILATPEPAMPLTFAACLGVALLAVRKSHKQTVAE